MINGSCLCGKINFEAEELPGMVFNCHCSRCRKSHGAAFSTQVVCQKDSLRFLTGKELLTEHISENMIRTFCSGCGSRLMNYDKQGQYLSVSVAAINDRPDLKPIGECFVPDKLEFVQLDRLVSHYDSLPDISKIYSNARSAVDQSL